MYGGEVRIGKDLVGFLSDRCNRLARLADEPWAKRTLEFLRALPVEHRMSSRRVAQAETSLVTARAPSPREGTS